MGPQRMFGLTPWVRRLLVANLLVFLLQVTLFTSPRFRDAFGFVPLHALARPWTFLTYMFLHAGVLHLAFNLLMLYVFGPSVEDRMGGRPFITYYVLCGLGGAALSFVLMQFVPMIQPMVGASGAILGVAVAFAWYWPDHPVFVFPLPEPIAAKWLITFLVALDLVLAWGGVSDGVAHLAHLGGVAAGFTWLKGQDWRLARAERHLRRVSEPSVLVTPASRAAPGARGGGGGAGGGSAPAATSRPTPDARVHAEIDRVLDKISATGLESLTPAERRFLTETSRRMRNKP
jgi:membrane associated rhomboid family serine protease